MDTGSFSVTSGFGLACFLAGLVNWVLMGLDLGSSKMWKGTLSEMRNGLGHVIGSGITGR